VINWRAATMGLGDCSRVGGAADIQPARVKKPVRAAVLCRRRVRSARDASESDIRAIPRIRYARRLSAHRGHAEPFDPISFVVGLAITWAFIRFVWAAAWG
jgi:hypothetical protein